MSAKEYNKLKEGTPLKYEDTVIRHYVKYTSFKEKGIMVGTVFYSYKDLEIVKEN